MRLRVELVEPKRLLQFVAREVVLRRARVESAERHVGRGQVGRQREGAQRRFACRLDVLRVALLGELQEVGAPRSANAGANRGSCATIFSSSGIAVSSACGR